MRQERGILLWIFDMQRLEGALWCPSMTMSTADFGRICAQRGCDGLDFDRVQNISILLGHWRNKPCSNCKWADTYENSLVDSYCQPSVLSGVYLC